MRDLPVDAARANRVVTRWRREMSDGCSVPSYLRLFAPKETPAECAVCERHDELYYYGGSRARRRSADAEFRSGMIGAGMPRLKAWMYWAAVRTGGVPWLKVKGVSWSFAGEHFKYAAKPAAPADDA